MPATVGVIVRVVSPLDQRYPSGDRLAVKDWVLLVQVVVIVGAETVKHAGSVTIAKVLVT